MAACTAARVRAVQLLCLTMLYCYPYVSPLVRHVTVPKSARQGHVLSSLVFWGQDYYISEAADDGDGAKSSSQLVSVLANGDVILNRDLELEPSSSFTLEVVNQLPSQLWRDVLHVEVVSRETDIAFTRSTYHGSVAENLPAGAVVSGLEDMFVLSKSSHVNGSVSYRYSLTPMDCADDLFLLHKHWNKMLTIKTNQVFDRETRTTYKLQIQACSEPCRNGTVVYADLQISIDDVNDNVPYFDQSVYETTINENLPPHSTIYSLQAKDADIGPLRYQFTQPSQLFDLDSDRGHVILTSKLRSPSYELFIVAVDPDNQTSDVVTLCIHVSEVLTFDPHVITRHKRDVRPVKEVEIPESYTGDLLDILNDNFDRFRFKEPEPPMLEIGRRTGTVRLRDGFRLDYETQREIDFTVVITRHEDDHCEYSCLYALMLGVMLVFVTQ